MNSIEAIIIKALSHGRNHRAYDRICGRCHVHVYNLQTKHLVKLLPKIQSSINSSPSKFWGNIPYSLATGLSPYYIEKGRPAITNLDRDNILRLIFPNKAEKSKVDYLFKAKTPNVHYFEPPIGTIWCNSWVCPEYPGMRKYFHTTSVRSTNLVCSFVRSCSFGRKSNVHSERALWGGYVALKGMHTYSWG